MAKNVLKYLKRTLNYELVFKKSENGLNLIGFCDSDWGSSNDRRSTTGYCYFLNEKGPTLSWKTRK